MCASDSLFAIFIVGEENVETLIAIVADKVIVRHTPILTESGEAGERLKLLFLQITLSYGDTITMS